MKILLIAPYLPWPLDAGGKYAQFTMIDRLRQVHAVTLVCNGIPGSAAAATLGARWPDVKLVLVPPAALSFAGRLAGAMYDFVWDLKDRFMELLPGLAGLLQKAVRNARNPRFAGLGGLVEIPDAPAEMAEAVAREAALGYDLIQVDFVDCLPLIDILPAGVPRVFVHHQIHFVFHERLCAERLNGDPRLRSRFEALKEREIGLLRRYDALLAFTDVDRGILSAIPGGPPVFCSPFGILEKDVRPETGAFNGTLVYVGSEYHYPNLDAVNWFLENVWADVVKARPELQFHIVGLWSEAAIERLEGHPNVRCRGFVPELEPLLWEAIMVVPLWIGSGIRTKILQAMMEGSPVISTSVGCEGIPARDGEEILLRDTAKGFAEAVVALAGDREQRSLLSRNARRMVSEKFSASVAGKVRETAYRAILEAWKPGSEAGAAPSGGPLEDKRNSGDWKMEKPARCSL